MVVNLSGRGDKDLERWRGIWKARRDDRPHRSALCRAARRRPRRARHLHHGGDPDHATSLAILKALPQAGADVIELGMPFTDPMADGPAIQAAGCARFMPAHNMKKTLAWCANSAPATMRRRSC